MLRFYRDAMAWYLQSWTRKFINSLNEVIKDQFAETAENINDCISELYREGDISLYSKVEAGFSTITSELSIITK